MIFIGGWGGGGRVGGQEDVFGPGYFFRLLRDPVFLFANNRKRMVEFYLSWIFFHENWVLDFFSRKLFLLPPRKNQMVAPLVR